MGLKVKQVPASLDWLLSNELWAFEITRVKQCILNFLTSEAPPKTFFHFALCLNPVSGDGESVVGSQQRWL